MVMLGCGLISFVGPLLADIPGTGFPSGKNFLYWGSTAFHDRFRTKQSPWELVCHLEKVWGTDRVPPTCGESAGALFVIAQLTIQGRMILSCRTTVRHTKAVVVRVVQCLELESS